MSSVARWFASLLLFLALAAPVHAAEGRSAHIQAKLIAASATVAPGGDIDLALDYTAAPGWHTYWINPGDTGLAPVFKWNLPDGLKPAQDVLFPTPKRLPSFDLMSYGYEGRTILVIPMHNGSSLAAGQALPIHAKVDFLVCADVCIPESLEVSLRLVVGAPQAGADARTVAQARAALPVDAGASGGTIDLRNGMVELGFRLHDAHPDGAWFYPEQSGVLEPVAPEAVDMGPMASRFAPRRPPKCCRKAN